MAADRELSGDEILERLPVLRETLIRWLQCGELKGRRIAERKGGWRVRSSDLEQFIHVRGLDRPGRRPGGKAHGQSRK